MPEGVGYPGRDQMLSGIDQMLGGADMPAPPMDAGMGGGMDPAATDPTMSEGGGPDIVAGLVAENTHLRMLVGLGPNDPLPPIPMGEEPDAMAPAADPGGAGGMPPV